MSTEQQDLRDRIAQALADHTLAEATARRTAVDPATRALVEKIAADRATTLMPLIKAELDERDARIRYLEAEIDRADLRTQKAAVAARDSRITELESRTARSRTHRADLTRKNGDPQAPAGAATERDRIRAAIQAEIDDHDPDHTFRDLAASPQPGQGDPGHAGNSWWRAYVHVGGLLHALACLEPSPADAATELTRHDQAYDLYDAGHCTDPDPHTPHEYADDTDTRHCTGTPTTAPTHTEHKE